MDLFRNIESSYQKRTSGGELRKNLWQELLTHYPPHFKQLYDKSKDIPSTLFSLHGGDIGLSILWIIQFSLIWPIFSENPATSFDKKRKTNNFTISESDIGAFAHTDDQLYPLEIKDIGNNLLALNGRKRFITGLGDADFLLMTAHMPDDPLISHIVYIPVKLLPEECIFPVEMDYLPTIDHSEIIFQNFTLPADSILPVKHNHLRSAIKKWSTFERVLTAEAYSAFCLYIVETSLSHYKWDPSFRNEIKALHETFKEKTRQILKYAVKNQIKEADRGLIKKIIPLAKIIHEKCTEARQPLPGPIALRLNDLQLINLISN